MSIKRIYGPDLTVLPKTSSATEKLSANHRVDGRNKHDMRPIFCELGTVGQAIGSAFLETGSSKVVCSV